METRYVLTDYVHQALAEASYEKLDDDSYAGRVPACPGVTAFGSTLRRCEEELRSTLEDWILVEAYGKISGQYGPEGLMGVIGMHRRCNCNCSKQAEGSQFHQYNSGSDWSLGAKHIQTETANSSRASSHASRSCRYG